MKKCNYCYTEKDLSNFTKNNRNKDNLENTCKKCRNSKMKENYKENRETIRKNRKVNYDNNKEIINKRKRDNYKIKKESIIEYNKKYLENNPDYRKRYKEYQKEYHKSKKYKEYKEKNINRIKEYDKEYRSREDVKVRINKQSVKRNRIRKKKDILFKLKVSIRSSISNNFRCGGFKKSKKTEAILGCSFEDFKLYLESKFEDWMNWDNKGLYNGHFNHGWDIDHIIPLCSAEKEEDLIYLNHYTNLQPLCSKTNREIKRQYEMPV
jgi:hypothetical protein